MRICKMPRLVALLLAGVTHAPWADDTDIYLNRGGTRPSVTRVMLALDVSAPAGEVVCVEAAPVEVAAEDCRPVLGERVYQELDLYGLAYDERGRQSIQRGADGVPDREQEDPVDPAGTVRSSYWPGTAVRRTDTLRAALRVVLGESAGRLQGDVAHPGLEVGLMLTHADDCEGAGPAFAPDYGGNIPRACSKGAYVLQGFIDLRDPANLDTLLKKIAAIPDPGLQASWMDGPWAGHPYNIRDIYLELFRYLTGQGVFNGYLGASDFGSRMAGNLYHNHQGPVSNDVLMVLPDGTRHQPLLAPDTGVLLPGSFDLPANRVDMARYRSPLQQVDECARLFLVHALSGPTGDPHVDTDSALGAAVIAGGLLPGGVPAGKTGDLAAVAALLEEDLGSGVFPGMNDIWGRQGVSSYFIGNPQDAHFSAMALAGGTHRALPGGDSRSLLEALQGVFNEALAVSTTFVAATLAPSQAGNGGVPRDIYFALFQPDSRPRWSGNVKKLRLVSARLPDPASGEWVEQPVIAQAPLARPPVAALSPLDGRLRRDALTYWTDPAGADVLDHDPAAGERPGTDGRSVERGGAGQQVPGFLDEVVAASNEQAAARQLFTEDPDNRGALLPLDADMPELASISGYLDPQDQLPEAGERRLIRWVRGQDAFDIDGDGLTQEPRSWLMGDIQHSRPLVVNYGARPGTGYSLENPDIRLFFGANDGLFRILKNTEAGDPGRESGRETWGFIPLELLRLQSVLAQNLVGPGMPHPYGMDGEAVALVEDQDRDGTIEAQDGDRVWVFIGQRRGGRNMFAFDMTDPDNPRFKWKINNESPGFGQLALTFSTPQVTHLDFDGGAARPVLVFAGGYNGGWDGVSRAGKDAGDESDLIGNAIYIVDADDGSLIWRAVGPATGAQPGNSTELYFAPGMTDSIPSPVTVIDSNGNGLADRAYVGDSGGKLWRIELTEYRLRKPGTEPRDAGNWYVRLLADLGGSGRADRRFFHAPDYVRTRDEQGDYDGLVIVSGNRADPLEELSENFAYLIKDRLTGVAGGDADPDAPAQAIPVTSHEDLIDVSRLCVSGEEQECLAADLAPGWKLQLSGVGEKGLSSPVVSNGTVLFSSYLPRTGPPGDACAPAEGSSRVYTVRLANGAARFPPPGPVLASHRFNPVGPGIQGAVVPYGDRILMPGLGLDGQPLFRVPGPVYRRAYWLEGRIDAP